jgi:hypothetical protein
MWQERNIVNSTIEIIQKNKKLGLNLDESTTAEEWAEIGKQLLVGNKMLNWCIGDWLVFGERKNFATLSSELGFDEGYLRNLKWIAKEFPMSSRRDNISHKHYQILAPLDKDSRKEWLEKIQKESLSTRDLTMRVRSAYSDVERDDSAPVRTLTSKVRTLVSQLLEASEKWDESQKKAWKAEIQPLVSLYEEL